MNSRTVDECRCTARVINTRVVLAASLFEVYSHIGFQKHVHCLALLLSNSSDHRANTTGRGKLQKDNVEINTYINPIRQVWSYSPFLTETSNHWTPRV